MLTTQYVALSLEASYNYFPVVDIKTAVNSPILEMNLPLFIPSYGFPSFLEKRASCEFFCNLVEGL